jgi:hypothetical protein
MKIQIIKERIYFAKKIKSINAIGNHQKMPQTNPDDIENKEYPHDLT